MSREKIAKKLKELRQKSGLTANEVGEMVGKSGKTVNAWEHGLGQPDAELLIRLCDIYDVDDILAEFRDDEKEKAPAEEADARAIEFVNLFSSLSDQQKDLTLAFLKALLQSGS